MSEISIAHIWHTTVRTSSSRSMFRHRNRTGLGEFAGH